MGRNTGEDDMPMYASWVHGNAFQPAERPLDGLTNVDGIAWTDVVGLRQGQGASFRGEAGRANWFHVPIPTPVIVDDRRVRLTQIWLMFQCGTKPSAGAASQEANITNIHVWDGPNRIALFGPFNLFGDHRFRLGNGNNFRLNAPQEIFFGIGLSVHVAFRFEGTVQFAAAGADFEI
jgi:hypothetical protein